MTKHDIAETATVRCITTGQELSRRQAKQGLKVFEEAYGGEYDHTSEFAIVTLKDTPAEWRETVIKKCKIKANGLANGDMAISGYAALQEKDPSCPRYVIFALVAWNEEPSATPIAEETVAETDDAIRNRVFAELNELCWADMPSGLVDELRAVGTLPPGEQDTQRATLQAIAHLLKWQEQNPVTAAKHHRWTHETFDTIRETITAKHRLMRPPPAPEEDHSAAHAAIDNAAPVPEPGSLPMWDTPIAPLEYQLHNVIKQLDNARRHRLTRGDLKRHQEWVEELVNSIMYELNVRLGAQTQMQMDIARANVNIVGVRATLARLTGLVETLVKRGELP